VRATQNSAAVASSLELHSALCEVTETLARELGSPSLAAPDWSPFQWTVARAVAAMHGISPLLSRSLVWRGPDAWTRFLSEQRAHTRARHAGIQQLLQCIDHAAREASIPVTALKGAALHDLGLYAAGDRPMADVDLLVRPADRERTTALLESLGFVQSDESWKERVFTPVSGTAAADLGEHATNSLKIELHERICEKLPLRIADVSDCVFPSQPQPGLNRYPSNGSLMRHLLLHAAGSMAFQALRMLQLHDIALLAGRMTEADWREVCSAVSIDQPWWAYPPLELASRYYPAAIPGGVLLSLKPYCPRVLHALATRKSLTNVSYSYLWVKAFPGIEWSRSANEVLSYMLGRIQPDKRHLASRKQVAATEVWSKQGDWSSMSQARRIMRWLSSRQARPVTMHAVAAAFAQHA
jgi:hypothetical protein